MANYFSQFYATALGLLVLPFYLSHLGAESYGLIGFFMVLQALITLLDAGLTPTVSRTTTQLLSQSIYRRDFNTLFRRLQLVLVLVSGTTALAVTGSAQAITSHWLNVQDLAVSQAVLCVQLMGWVISLKWLGGLYRGVLIGSESFVRLAAHTITFATLRFLGVFVSFAVFETSATVFFAHQLGVAVLELAVLCGLARWRLSQIPAEDHAHNKERLSLKSIAAFALIIGFSSIVWVASTQTDRLILSGILELADYGIFTLAVLLGGGIIFIANPLSMLLMPRLTALFEQERPGAAIELYRECTQLVVIICGSASVVMGFMGQAVMLAWTGDATVAAQAGPILQLYALGNGLLVLGAFPFYLQYAKGRLKYHLIGNLITLIVAVPAFAHAATDYGAIGAGWVWVSLNASWLFIATPLIHSRLVKGLNSTWFGRDIFAIIAPVTATAGLTQAIMPDTQSQFSALASVILVTLIALLTAAASSSASRRRVQALVHRYRHG